MAARETDMSPMGGRTRLTTRDGATIRVEVEYPNLSVVVEGRGSVRVPYPRAGYGGHELLLSAEETYLAMWLYSGQSEVGYELFEFSPALRHLGGLPYVVGEGVGPAFSADERLLALTWATNPGLCVEAEDLHREGRTIGDRSIEWATVRIQELPSGPATTSRISVQVPADFPLEGDENYYPTRVRFVHGREVRFDTDWGTEVRVALPLPEVVTIKGPLRRTVDH